MIGCQFVTIMYVSKTLQLFSFSSAFVWCDYFSKNNNKPFKTCRHLKISNGHHTKNNFVSVSLSKRALCAYQIVQHESIFVTCLPLHHLGLRIQNAHSSNPLGPVKRLVKWVIAIMVTVLKKEQVLSSARQGMVNVDGIVGFVSYCVANSKVTKSILEFRLMRISSA